MSKKRIIECDICGKYYTIGKQVDEQFVYYDGYDFCERCVKAWDYELDELKETVKSIKERRNKQFHI